jgi:hypothetical protein
MKSPGLGTVPGPNMFANGRTAAIAPRTVSTISAVIAQRSIAERVNSTPRIASSASRAARTIATSSRCANAVAATTANVHVRPRASHTSTAYSGNSALPPIASISRAPTTIGGTTTGSAQSTASAGRRPRSRCAHRMISNAVATFIASSGSFSATSVGPSTHMTGAARYASIASR